MKKREDLHDSLKWNTDEIFSSVEEWESLYDKVSNEMDFFRFEGKLSNPEILLECFKAIDRVSLNLEKLGVYAFMRHDEDTVDGFFNALVSRCDALEIKFNSSSAFIMPEITALDTAFLEGLACDSRFSDYDYQLKCIIREKPHVLSKETEEILALGGNVYQGYKNVFSMINNADIKFPVVEVGSEKVELSHGVYSVLMQSENREVRKNAFKAYYSSFNSLLNTITAAYIGSVEKDVFLAKSRKHSSCLDAALLREDVNKSVYDNLLREVNRALPTLHNYVENKKKSLNLIEMNMFDMYVPLVVNTELKLEYSEAYALVIKGLDPLGDEYKQLLMRAYNERWIDVEETQNKRSGAYSIHVHALNHPYVLLNYQKTTNDIFTIAHEMGHALHSWYSSKNQPQSKSDYKIFVAEVASTVNEVLLLKYLLKATDDKDLKKFLLSYYMDMIKGTLFRQTMFAEFEYKTHSLVESNKPLTKDLLCEIYLELNKRYYGEAVVSDAEIAFEWARIPHFYRAFYVYKYATGIVSAISIAERIYSEGQPAVDDYFKFLSSGGSDSPVELLKLAGVNLNETKPFNIAMQSFESALNDFMALN